MVHRVPLSLSLGVILLSLIDWGDSCSCMLTHPQELFCNADFVILARIKQVKEANGMREYKIKIRKEYKMSEKSIVALKYGRLLSPLGMSCEINLDVNKIYALSGRVVALKAYINLCGMAEDWTNLSRRQRKGLKMLYHQGCTFCKIRRCLSPSQCQRSPTSCNWTTWSKWRPGAHDCQSREGICLRNSKNECKWSRTQALQACTHNNTVIPYQPRPQPGMRLNNQVIRANRKKYSPFRDDPGRRFDQ